MIGRHHRIVFISWAENCSRSDNIARRLNGDSIMVYSPFWGSRYSTIVPKYLSQSWKTLRLLVTHRPTAVIVMTPPVAACFPVWLYCTLTGARYAIDAHTGAFLDPRWKKFAFLHRFFSRWATTTMVTNAHLENLVKEWGATATIIPDVPIAFPEPKDRKVTGEQVTMTLVSSFTWDEPLDVFLRAAEQVPDIQFFVTGKVPADQKAVIERKPANVTFTGFLSNPDYCDLLRRSDAVISLTTLDHTMQRAAYEAVYLGKPVITSKFPLLQREFDRGAVHVDNTPDSIATGIRRMRENIADFSTQVLALREAKLARWDRAEHHLRLLLS
jgi:glycosyltransferase involved in cell wall biosynthesis